MMESLLECVLRNVLTTRKDVFGEQCVFVEFELDSENYDCSAGFQSKSRFGRIVYRRADGTIQRSDGLVLKISPLKPFMKYFSTLQFFNEVFFYTRILPFFSTYGEIDHLFPRYYNSLLQYNVDSDELAIVFENIQARGYRAVAKKSFLDYDHLTLMLKKLGEFHAYSYHARQTHPARFRALMSEALETNIILLNEYGNILAPLVDRGLQPLLNDSRYNTHHQKLRKLMDESEKIVEYTLKGDEQNHTHVLCHGDFLRSNVLFKYENGKPVDLKLVDMASWRFASPAYDLALVLYLNADQEMRERNWDKLIDTYYSSVQSTFPFSEVPSKDSILAEFKNRALNGYFTASFFLTPFIHEDSLDVNEQGGYVDPYREATRETFDFDNLTKVMNEIGGEKGTIALTNILKDIVDRGFV